MSGQSGSADFPFESRYAHVRGSQMHYAIAFDMIGMGRSDKPEIPYRIDDQCEYFAGFVEELGLEGIHLVSNDWGTALAKSGLPALLLYYPEMAPAVESYRNFLLNLTAVEIDRAHHFMPEDQPDRVGEELARWIQRQPAGA